MNGHFRVVVLILAYDPRFVTGHAHGIGTFTDTGGRKKEGAFLGETVLVLIPLYSEY